jgi:hypothetical protein
VPIGIWVDPWTNSIFCLNLELSRNRSTQVPESKLRSKTPAHKSNRKTQIKTSERELKTREANPRSNLEPSIAIGA